MEDQENNVFETIDNDENKIGEDIVNTVEIEKDEEKLEDKE